MVPSNAAGSRAHPSHVLDFELFQELRESLGNELEIVAGLYRRFLTHTAKTLDELRDQPSATRAATLHALKGSAAMVGANRIAAIAEQLQESPAHEAIALQGSAIDALEGALAEFRLALSAHFESLGHRLT
jgi:HPt (histidine-containing phosphotransfer) domain-containing protein